MCEKNDSGFHGGLEVRSHLLNSSRTAHNDEQIIKKAIIFFIHLRIIQYYVRVCACTCELV